MRTFNESMKFVIYCNPLYINLYESINAGDLNKVIQFHNENKELFIKQSDQIFKRSCYFGQKYIAEWVMNNKKVESHYEMTCAINQSCLYGHFEIVKWLYELTHFASREMYFSFRNACRGGHLNMAKWIYLVEEIDIHNDHGMDCSLVTSVKKEGHNHILKWLHKLDLSKTYKNSENEDLPPSYEEAMASSKYIPRVNNFP